jgi:V-type H+-transporting ATPase subunit C
VIDPKAIVQDSEYIETHLVAVPVQLVKDFLKTYETVAPMVVPRSAQLVASDNEFTLYAVTAFKKHSVEFVHKCREQKWIPRDYKYVEGGKEEERKEVERVGGDERKLWGETLRLGRTAWSEAVMVWIHILVLRVFVETVLRYGLPLDFVCALVRVCFLVCALVFGGTYRLQWLTFWGVTDTKRQAGRPRKAKSRQKVLVPGRQCLWARQEGPRSAG